MSEKNITHYHMDKTVKYLFIIAFFTSASVLGYHFKNRSSCNEVFFKTDASSYTVDEGIVFSDLTLNAERWQWNFGDNNSSSQKSPLHYYKNAGTYDVELLVNGSCAGFKTIEIAEAIEIVDSTRFPVYTLPKTIRVGESLVIKDETNNATSWEWRFGETARVDNENRTATYVYKEAGLYTVKLVVNNDIEYVTPKKIRVLEEKKKASVLDNRERTPVINKNWNIPEYPEGYNPNKDDEEAVDKNEPITAPNISEKGFERMLLQVASGRKTALDFKKYFCGDIDKKVTVNTKVMTFTVLCQKITDKKIKIKSLNLGVEKGTNCINHVSLTYKRLIF